MNKIAILCLACKKGYKPIYGKDKNGDTIEMVGKCEFIENCLTSSWFNNCSKCKDDFAFPFVKEDTYEISFDKCVKSTVKNCLFYDTKNKNCFKCKKGF